ncbi:MAG: phosphotransferase enzyme family protein [Chitinophagaceae bacterium]
MKETDTLKILSEKYDWSIYNTTVLKSGLINQTIKVETKHNSYIVQQINKHVFKNPQAIDNNITHIGAFLNTNFPNYSFIKLVPCKHGNTLHLIENNYFRVFELVKNSKTIEAVENEHQAFEAANKFGEFTALLKHFPTKQLQTTLPNFHNLSLRYNQFLSALKNGNKSRIVQCNDLIKTIENNTIICKKFEHFISNKNALQRVTHHDTKISNVLFNEDNHAICVIDLDTVMPGYFLSDVGDMIRTYVSPTTEEDDNFDKIFVRKEFLQAIKEGYLQHMKVALTPFEMEHFFFSGEALIYMQALRFLTDYFNNDVYYTTTYKEQNFIRATNQLTLLKQLQINT